MQCWRQRSNLKESTAHAALGYPRRSCCWVPCWIQWVIFEPLSCRVHYLPWQHAVKNAHRIRVTIAKKTAEWFIHLNGFTCSFPLEIGDFCFHFPVSFGFLFSACKLIFERKADTVQTHTRTKQSSLTQFWYRMDFVRTLNKMFGFGAMIHIIRGYMVGGGGGLGFIANKHTLLWRLPPSLNWPAEAIFWLDLTHSLHSPSVRGRP